MLIVQRSKQILKQIKDSGALTASQRRGKDKTIEAVESRRRAKKVPMVKHRALPMPKPKNHGWEGN